ncbi:MAG: 50S ribosomal protein L11 methyltransferase [Acidobacteriia bacterium]|nr:50S ribosomal protein L11 methyltransferase [Terriglobia bacterium]
MTKDYVEIHLVTSAEAGELVGLLEETACLGASEQEGGLHLYWPKDRWHPEVLGALKGALRQLGDRQAEDTITISELPDQDWNERWAASLEPIRLGARILVRQSWNSAAIPAGGFELVIDPKRAFGTGYHATTQLIAEWLEEVIQGGERLLDVGTGSGILAMVALRLGAGAALGIDNDPEAIECAGEYAAANGFGPELELRVAALEDLHPEQFDLVVANLDRKMLLRYFPMFHTWVRPGGSLLVSGLLSDDHPGIRAALATTGWVERSRRERDEWMALELRKAGRRIEGK